jgi:hypothetical protein
MESGEARKTASIGNREENSQTLRRIEAILKEKLPIG